ncbi:MAG: hypothetical protein U0U46_07005 [Saprospiraceae bacterium]|nr:hypothetical protein [Saprospiraceae bacterium]HNL39089.1 hypothetical protein [Saprospiraceae bacterium]
MEEQPLDQPQTPFEPPKTMPLGKVVMINFIIMLVYMALTSTMATSGGSEAGLGMLIADAMLIAAQAGLNFVIGLIFVFTDLRHVGQAMLISSLLVGAVGFGLCIGKASVFG